MKNLLVYTSIIGILLLFQAESKGQCSGDLNAQNLAHSPSVLYSCGQVTVTAEWLQQAQEGYDAAFHQSKLIISLPTEFIGTSGTLSITATDNNIYWNASGITVTDDEIQVPLQGVIPSGEGITIILSDMDMIAGGGGIIYISQSVSNVVADCEPTNDEQSLPTLVNEAEGPQTSLSESCTDTELAIDLNAQPGATNGGAISSYSWTGPNGFTSSAEDPNFTVAANEKDAYTGDYIVTVTDANGCTTMDTISLDGSNCLALPVELMAFTASPGKDIVDLTWKTATELNNNQFDIERSADGRNFTKIGEVAGSGTTSEVINYSFTDDAPLSGKSYYRLKQVDFSGAYEYSHVEEVSFGGDSFLKIYPNPVAAGSEINILGRKIQSVKVYNVLGQLIINEAYERPRTNVIISSGRLTQGIYVTKVNGVHEKRVVVK